MNKKFYCVGKLFFWTLLVCGGVFIFSANAFAVWDMVTAELIHEGKEHYDNGRYEDAIHEFSKVLLSDPRNQEALSYLNRMGLTEGVYGARSNPVDRIYQLSEEILAYQKDLNLLESQNESHRQGNMRLKQRLQETIAQKEEEKQRLIEAGRELRSVAAIKLLEQQEHIGRLEQVQDAQTRDIDEMGKDIVELSMELVESREKLSHDEKFIADKHKELTALKEELEKNKHLSDEELGSLRLIYNKKLAMLEEDRNNLEQQVFTARNDHREKMQLYRRTLTDKETELKMEKNLSAVKSYQIARQERRYLDLKDQLEDLYRQKKVLFDEASELKLQISKLRQEQTFRAASSPKPLERKAAEYIRRQDQQIMDLKSRLVLLQGELKEARRQGALEDAQRVTQLERRTAELKREIAAKEKDLEFAREQQSVLEERVGEYKERLEIVEGMIKDKEERILFLEEQLGADVYPGH